MKNITDAEYMYVKKVCEDFETKSLGEYHNLYLKSDTLLLAEVFDKFFYLDPAKLLSAPGLA